MFTILRNSLIRGSLYRGLSVIVFYILGGGGMRDPGIRNQIFLPMMSNDLGYMELDGTFVTIDQNIKCDSTWREDIHHNLKSYIK